MILEDILYLVLEILFGGLSLAIAIIASKYASSKYKMIYLVAPVLTVGFIALTGFDKVFIPAYIVSALLILGFFFEKKLVNFKRPKAWYFGVLRVAVAIGLFYALNTILKLPFDKEFLESAGFLSYLVRTLRYAVTTFVITGLYPLTFRLGERIGHKK